MEESETKLFLQKLRNPVRIILFALSQNIFCELTSFLAA
jgi:hypothetical protein